MRWRKEKKEIEEKLAVVRGDRRALSRVPDPDRIRGGSDRRGGQDDSDPALFSMRFVADFDVQLTGKRRGGKYTLTAKAADISATGILVELGGSEALQQQYQVGTRCQLRFDIPPGTMPEGFESRVKVEAEVVRLFLHEENGTSRWMAGLVFSEPLTSYFKRRRWGYSIYMASGMLFLSALFIMLMRTESILYFKYNWLLYLYSIIAAVFLLSRYLFGALYRDVPVDPHYTPGVSIIIPCFNEEKWIRRTILSCINQDYPLEKLEVIVVDDRSTDRSVEEIEKVIAMVHQEAERFQVKDRLSLHVLPENGGKRVALVKGVELAKHPLVVFVDSDSFLEYSAVRNLVQSFKDPRMGGVAGRTDVENKFTNAVTKLQTVRYYIAFRIMKAAESYFDSVTCLSGPLSCYRKELVLQHKDAWLNQRFLGHPATFGDDRSMTNFILRTHRTGYQDRAICSTIVPSDMGVFLKQQMRWKRSWLRESLRAGSFIWRKEPFMSLFFYIGLIVPIAAPVIVLHNLVYVPIVHGIFPGTFLMGLLLMALLMSFAHLLFRKSRLWIFGLVFCVFYELVLLWQMPVAWFTFWKSTWGTRQTPQDVEAQLRKQQKRERKRAKEEGVPL